MKISFNAPFTLTFTAVAMVAGAFSALSNGAMSMHFFSVYTPIHIQDPYSILRLFTHILGHANLAHFSANFSLILLVGPMVENSYGSWRLFLMTLITAAVTGFVHIFFFNSALMGASGIAFMMILLGSLANSRKGAIPMSFLLVAFIYIGNELLMIFENDNVSQIAHIVGGLCGATFGLLTRKTNKTPNS